MSTLYEQLQRIKAEAFDLIYSYELKLGVFDSRKPDHCAHVVRFYCHLYEKANNYV